MDSIDQFVASNERAIEEPKGCCPLTCVNHWFFSFECIWVHFSSEWSTVKGRYQHFLSTGWSLKIRLFQMTFSSCSPKPVHVFPINLFGTGDWRVCQKRLLGSWWCSISPLVNCVLIVRWVRNDTYGDNWQVQNSWFSKSK